MTNFGEPELAFARAHIRSFYASDFFPDADEYDAVWAGWDEVVAYYKQANLTELGTTPEDMACAKATGGYRIVHQLLPLDAITYTAFAGIVAPHLEEKRVPASEGIACSYRLDPNPSGQLFKKDLDGYGLFHRRSVDLAASHNWVLSLDIAGFYNHIYIHRVEGAVAGLDPALKTVAHELHEFLLNLNDRVSVGVPVGPAASIIVSEAILNEIDQFLLNHRAHPTYTRYVDDYRLFSNSRIALEELWHDCSAYLHRSQRLTLANDKCRLMSSQEFRDKVLSPPEDPERARLAADLGIRFSEVASRYSEAHSRPEPPTKGDPSAEAQKKALETLLGTLLRDPEFNIGMARQLLRRARMLRMRCILRAVLENLERLAPVIRDVGLYLHSVLSDSAFERSAALFERFVKAAGGFTRGSHLHYWVAWVLTGRRGMSKMSDSAAFVDASLPRFGGRAARVCNRPAWVRDHRADWQRWANWDRWSLMHAAEVLPEKERRVWMDSVCKSPDLVDRLVARRVKAL